MTGDYYTVLFVKGQALHTLKGVLLYKLSLKKHNLRCPVSLRVLSSSGTGKSVPLPRTHCPGRPRLGMGTYISSPDFSKQISVSCPRAMSSVSSGVSELDAVSLKCDESTAI